MIVSIRKNVSGLLLAYLFGIAVILGFNMFPMDLTDPSCISPPEIYKVKIRVQAAREVIDSLLVVSNSIIQTRKETDGQIDPQKTRRDALFSFFGSIASDMNEDLFDRGVQIEPMVGDNFDSPQSESVVDKGCTNPNAFDMKANMALSAMINTTNSIIGGNLIISYCMESHDSAVNYVYRKHGNCGFLVLVKWNGLDDTALSIKKGIIEVITGSTNSVDSMGNIGQEDSASLCGWAGKCIGHIESKIGHIEEADSPLIYNYINMASITTHAD